VKVKFGGANGEVYAEVAASRLLWALGFGADRMYPVRVICRGCPAEFGGVEQADGTRLFEPAVIERKMPGDNGPAPDGWSWQELEAVDEKAGGATLAQRDALKLLAVFIQHTDSKPEQQRLICLDDGETGSKACAQPFRCSRTSGSRSTGKHVQLERDREHELQCMVAHADLEGRHEVRRKPAEVFHRDA
jgi:hypothetical protein